MNIDQLQEVWATQHVTGNRTNVPQLVGQLRHEARQRSRRVLRITAIATFIMGVGLAIGLAAHLTGIRTFSAVTLATFLTGTLLNVGVVVFTARVHRRVHREYLEMGETLADSLRGSLIAIECQIRDCAVAGCALAVISLVQVAATYVHYATSHLPFIGLVANAVLTLLFAAGIAATLRHYVRTKLIPQRDELRREVAEL
jgi:hypothetical protein